MTLEIAYELLEDKPPVGQKRAPNRDCFRLRPQSRCNSSGDSTLQLQGLARGDLDKVVELIGSNALAEDSMERQVPALVGDHKIARRAIDWTPEEFALVVVGHLAKVNLPTTFSAKDQDGAWHQFPLSAEPTFAQAMRKAAETFHHGSRDLFGAVAKRSGILGAVNKALNAGQISTARHLAVRR